MITITPYAITQRAMMTDALFLLLRPRRGVEQSDDLGLDMFEPRMTVEIESDDPHEALEKVWTMFQNLSDGEPDEDGNVEPRHVTPDGDRSLMVGDHALVKTPDGSHAWWRCMPFGWEPTKGWHLPIKPEI